MFKNLSQLLFISFGLLALQSERSEAQIVRLDLEPVFFVIGDAEPQDIGPVWIAVDDSLAIQGGSTVSLRIPADTPLLWPVAGNFEINYSEGKIDNHRFQDGKTLLLDIGETWVAGDSLSITGLQLVGINRTNAPTRLELVGDNQVTLAQSSLTWGIGDPSIEISSKGFVVGDPPTELGELVVRESPVAAGLGVGRQLRFVLPSELQMTWDTSVLQVSLGGAAANRLASSVEYTPDAKTASLTVTENFIDGDHVIIEGFKCTNFTGVSTSSIELEIASARGTELQINTQLRRSEQELRIGDPSIEISSKGFVVGDPSTELGELVVRESPVAAGLGVGRQLRFVFPSELQMTWDTSVLQVSLAGSAAGSVDSSVEYTPDARTAILTVIEDFIVDGFVVIEGLKCANFTEVSPETSLELWLSNTQLHKASANSLRVGNPVLSLSSDRVFISGDLVDTLGTITITESEIAAGLTRGRNIQVKLPSNLGIKWYRDVGTPLISGSAGRHVDPETFVYSDSVTFEVAVIKDFLPGDMLVLSGLNVTNLNRSETSERLSLTVNNSGRINSESETTIAVAQPLIESQDDLTFTVQDGSSILPQVIIADDAFFAGLRAGKEIRIVIPEEAALRWDSDTSPNISGASGKLGTPRFESEKVFLVPVIADFVANESIRVDGLAIASETPQSRMYLQLSLNSDNIANAEDERWIQVGQPQLSSERDHIFALGQGGVDSLYAITIKENQLASSIGTTNHIELILSDENQVRWGRSATDSQVDLIDTDGQGSTKIAVEAEIVGPSQRILRILVKQSFDPGDSLVIRNLPIYFDQVATPFSISLQVTPGIDAVDDKSIRVGDPYVDYLRDQVVTRDTLFVVGDSQRFLPTLEIREHEDASIINAVDDLFIVLPGNFSGTWISGEVKLEGTASGKIAPIADENFVDDRLRLDVIEDFSPNEDLRISGLTVGNFESAAPREFLTMNLLGVSDKRDVVPLSVGSPMLKSVVPQSFILFENGEGDEEEILSTIEIHESEITPSIIVEDEVRLVIPQSLPIEWSSVDQYSFSGEAASKVGTIRIVSPDTLAFSVKENFSAGDRLAIDSLRVRGMSQIISSARLELSVTNGESINAQDVNTKRIGNPALSSINRQRFIVNSNSVRLNAVQIAEDFNAGSIDSVFALRLPSEMDMIWSQDQNPTLPDDVEWDPSQSNEQTLYFRINQPSTAGRQIRIENLLVDVGESVSDDYRLVLSVNGGIDDTDEYVKWISGEPSFSIESDVRLVVNDPDTSLVVRISDNQSRPSIIEEEELVLALPEAMNLQWADIKPVLVENTENLIAEAELDVESKTWRIKVARDLNAGELLQLRVVITNFSSVLVPNQIVLSVKGDTLEHSERSAERISIGQPKLSSQENQIFLAGLDNETERLFSIGDSVFTGPAICAPFAIVENEEVASISAANGIRVSIPDSLSMSWYPVEKVFASGAAADKLIGLTPNLADGSLVFIDDKTVFIQVIADFVPGDSLRIEGLQLRGFDAPSIRAPLLLSVNGGRSINDEDEKHKRVGSPSVFTRSTQRFIVGEESVIADTLYIVEDLVESAISKKFGAKISIGLDEQDNLLFLSSNDVELGGTAAVKIASLELEDDNKSLSLRLNEDFAAGDTLKIAGLKLGQFSRASFIDNFYSLSVSQNPVDVVSPQGGQIGDLRFSSDASEVFLVNDIPRKIPSLRIEEPTNTSILVGGDTIHFDIPEGANFTWIKEGQSFDVERPRLGLLRETATIGQPVVTPINLLGTPVYHSGGKRISFPLLKAPDADTDILIENLSIGQFLSRTSGSLKTSFTLFSNDGDSARLQERFSQSDSNRFYVGEAEVSSDRKQSFLTGVESLDVAPITIRQDPNWLAFRSGEIRLYIPSGLAAQWDDSRSELSVAENSKLLREIRYVKDDEGRVTVAILTLQEDLEPGESLTFSGLAIKDRTNASASTQLLLSLNNGESVQGRDIQSIRIGNPMIMVHADDQFVDGLRDTMVFIRRSVEDLESESMIEPIYPLRFVASDTSAALVSGDEIRIRIPSDFPARWFDGSDPLSVESWSTNGGLYEKPKLAYERTEEEGAVLTLKVLEDWLPGDSTVVRNAQLQGFSEVAVDVSLQMEIRRFFTKYTREKMRIGSPSISTIDIVDEVFIVGDPSASKRAIVIFEDESSAGIVAERDIRVAIPEELSMVWDVEKIESSIRFFGSEEALQKVSKEVLFERDQRVLVIPVVQNFAPGERLEVHGLHVRDFATSSIGGLELWPLEDGRVRLQDPSAIYVGAPRFYSASDQTFVVGDLDTELLPLTIVEDANVATIRAGNEIRIVLPRSLNAQWIDQTEFRLSGSASNKVSFERFDGDTLRFAINETFDVDEEFRLSGLKIGAFSGPSPRDRMGLAVTAIGNVHTYDEQEKMVGFPTIENGQTLALPLDITPAMGDRKGEIEAQNLSFTIVESPVASSIRGQVGVKLKIPEDLGQFIVWDLSGTPQLALNDVPIGTDDVFRVEKDSTVLHIQLTQNTLNPGDKLGVNGLRVKVRDRVYREYMSEVIDQLPLTNAIGVIVHGDSDSLYYGDIAIPNANADRVIGVTETPLELFLPVAFDRPRLFSDKDGSWLVFHTAPDLLGEDVDRQQLQIFRHEDILETLFIDAGERPEIIRKSNRIEFDGHPVLLDEVRVRLSERELIQINRWFDNSSLGSGNTKLELRFQENVGLSVAGREFEDRSVAGRSLLDPENSAVLPVGYMSLVQPELVRLPLGSRYFDPRLHGETAGKLRVPGLSLGSKNRSLGQLIVVNHRGRDTLSVEEVDIEDTSLVLPDVLPEGVNQLRVYFKGNKDTLSLPVIREVVVDTTAPIIARSSGIRGSLTKASVDSVEKPQLRKVGADSINALSPIAGIGRYGEGFSVTQADTFHTRVVDNMYVEAIDSSINPLAARQLRIWRDEDETVDSLHFAMPVHRYPLKIAFIGYNVDGTAITNFEIPSDLIGVVSNLFGVNSAQPIWSTEPVVVGDTGDSLSIQISMPAHLNPSGSPSALFPFAALPAPLLVDGIQLSMELIATDGAGHIDRISTGGNSASYTFRTGEQGTLLTDGMINFPNPFASLPGLRDGIGTTIRFALTPLSENRANAKLRIFDSGGDLVYTTELANLAAGEHAFSWPGNSLYGEPLATGVYFAILEVQAEGRTEVDRHIMAILNR